MRKASRSRRLIGRAVLAAVGVTGLVAATRPLLVVKGLSYRVRVQTQMPNGGGGGGGDAPPGGGFRGGGQNVQLVRVDLAGERAKVEFQVGNPPGSSITDYYLMILDSNKVYRVSPDAQTFTDAMLATGGGRGGRGGGPGGGGGGNPGGGGRGGDRPGNPGRGGGNNGADNGGRGGRGGGGINAMTVLNDAVITGITTKVEDLGAGEAIETRPTRHYKITVDYAFKLYGQDRSGKTVSEIWAVDFPQRVVNPFDATTVAGDTMTSADVTRRLMTEARKIQGVHVKTVVTQTIPVGAVGGEVEVTTAGSVPQTVNITRTTLITALKEADVDQTVLVIPAGYKKAAGFGRGGESEKGSISLSVDQSLHRRD